MSSGYLTKNYLQNGTAVVIGASETDTVVASSIARAAEDSMVTVVAVTSSAVTSTTGITATIQSSFDGGTTWEDSDDASAAVAIAANGTIYLYHFADASTKPLGPVARVAVTSGASDAATIDSVYVSRRL